MKPEVADLQGNTISIRLEEGEGEDEDEEEEDGDVTPKVCQLDSVREVDECWSSISWSSLYDRGTDSSLSWADDVGLAGHEVRCHVSRAGVRAGDHGDGAAAAGRGGGAVLRPARGAEAEEGVPGVCAGAGVSAVAGTVPRPQVTPGRGSRREV